MAGSSSFSSHSGAHLGAAHHGSACGGTRSHVVSSVSLDSLKILLVLKFFFHILVSLEKFVMLELSLLESFAHVALDLLLEGRHLILLFLDEFGLSSDDLLMPVLHVLVPLFFLHSLGLHLNLMSLSILLLLG